MPLTVNPYDYTNCEICECELLIGSDEHIEYIDHPKYTHICVECQDNLSECEKCKHLFSEEDLVETNGHSYCEKCNDDIGEE